jgi:large subunit ribosomal protein L17
MRHRKAGLKLGRTKAHRQALWSNLVTSLVLHGRIETTEVKAKEVRRIADRTISWGVRVVDLLGKDGKSLSPADRARLVHARRMAGRVVRTDEALTKLFDDIVPQYKGRAGGYTRVLKTRNRKGDAAPMAFVELVAEG